MNYVGTTKERLDRLETGLSSLIAQVTLMAAAIADVLTELATLQASDAAADAGIQVALTNMTAAITDMTGSSATIASLKAQLAAALAGGTGATPAQLQTLMDGLTGVQTDLDATTVKVGTAATALGQSIVANPGT